MQTRTVRHSPTHIDIEELRTDEDGNQVWAVITCYNGEDAMTKFSKFDLKVGNHLYAERGELLDDALYAEMNSLPFPQVKSDRLAEVSEQIRLIENVTLEAQGTYTNLEKQGVHIAPDFKAEQLTGYFGKVKVTTSKEWDKRHLYSTREEQAGAAERRKAAGFQEWGGDTNKV